jgi:transcriptional regulator with XRE-family HTH domain
MARQESNDSETALARLIREWCDEHKESPRALSFRAGLGEDGVRSILSGRSKVPTSRTLKALAKAMGVPVASLSPEPGPIAEKPKAGRPYVRRGGLPEPTGEPDYDDEVDARVLLGIAQQQLRAAAETLARLSRLLRDTKRR